jgi:hypothetical protein
VVLIDGVRLVMFFLASLNLNCSQKGKGKGKGRGKGKAVPLQAWSGPEGSRKLRFPDYMTTAQNDGRVVSLTHRPPLPPEMLLVLISVRG